MTVPREYLRAVRYLYSFGTFETSKTRPLAWVEYGVGIFEHKLIGVALPIILEKNSKKP